jgi:two-component system sensor histidine kinase DesK
VRVLRSVAPASIGWEPYLHLVWLLYAFMQPLFDPEFGALGWALTGLALTLFLPVYLWAWRRGAAGGVKGAAKGALTMAFLGLIFSPFNVGISGFFIYAAAVAGYLEPPRRAAHLLGCILALLGAALLLSPVPWPYVLLTFAPVAVMATVIGVVNIFEAEKERANAKLRLAHEEIARLAKVAERERIARDLHDLLGHTLSMITLKSELASKVALSDPERAVQEMAEVATVSRGALKEVRETVRGYRAGGLAEEVRSAERALKAAGVAFSYRAEAVALTPAQERTLALALREAVTNVVRHAGATRCAVRLEHRGSEVTLTVEDDGCAAPAPEGAGLMGMRERAEALGGGLKRTLGRGTQLTVSLPGAAGVGAARRDLPPMIRP